MYENMPKKPKVNTRYFLLMSEWKAKHDPKVHFSSVLRADLEGNLKDMAEVLTISKVSHSRYSHYYQANANVDIRGSSLGEVSTIGLKVYRARVSIYRQPKVNPMVLKEITEDQARYSAQKVMDHKRRLLEIHINEER